MKKVTQWTKEGDAKVYLDDELILEFTSPKQLGERPRTKFYTKDIGLRLEALKQIKPPSPCGETSTQSK
jgi:hypothetical protein